MATAPSLFEIPASQLLPVYDTRLEHRDPQPELTDPLDVRDALGKGLQGTPARVFLCLALGGKDAHVNQDIPEVRSYREHLEGFIPEGIRTFFSSKLPVVDQEIELVVQQAYPMTGVPPSENWKMAAGFASRSGWSKHPGAEVFTGVPFSKPWWSH